MRLVGVAVGDTVFEGHPLVFVEAAEVGGLVEAAADEVDLDDIRPDLAEVIERHAVTLDAARPEAVARRRKTGQRTARENIDDLVRPRHLRRVRRLVLTAGHRPAAWTR